MALLAGVAAGEVTRRDQNAPDDPVSTSVWAPHYWRGVPVRGDLRALRDDELIDMPISGPPRLAPRGEALLKRRRAGPGPHG